MRILVGGWILKQEAGEAEVLARVTPPKESGGAHITFDAAAVGSDAEQGTA